MSWLLVSEDTSSNYASPYGQLRMTSRVYRHDTYTNAWAAKTEPVSIRPGVVIDGYNAWYNDLKNVRHNWDTSELQGAILENWEPSGYSGADYSTSYNIGPSPSLSLNYSQSDITRNDYTGNETMHHRYSFAGNGRSNSKNHNAGSRANTTGGGSGWTTVCSISSNARWENSGGSSQTDFYSLTHSHRDYNP